MNSRKNKSRLLEGHVDQVFENGQIFGWARFLDGHNSHVTVCAKVDGEVVAVAIANKYRADLVNRNIGNGCFGFEMTIDSSNEFGLHQEIEIMGEGVFPLVNSPVVIGAGDSNKEGFGIYNSNNQKNYGVSGFLNQRVQEVRLEQTKRRITRLLGEVEEVFGISTAIHLSYWIYLKRAADPSGFDSNFKSRSSGTSWNSIVDDIFNSEEFRSDSIRSFRNPVQTLELLISSQRSDAKRQLSADEGI